MKQYIVCWHDHYIVLISLSWIKMFTIFNVKYVCIFNVKKFEKKNAFNNCCYFYLSFTLIYCNCSLFCSNASLPIAILSQPSKCTTYIKPTFQSDAFKAYVIWLKYSYPRNKCQFFLYCWFALGFDRCLFIPHLCLIWPGVFSSKLSTTIKLRHIKESLCARILDLLSCFTFGWKNRQVC